MANTATPRINKSEVVRQILNEIGAVNETPPEGWRATVEERLSKHKGKDGKPMKMNAVTIYQLRRTEIDKKAGKRKTRATNSAKFNDLEKLVEVKKFAETVGGIEQLEQAIAFLKQLG